jgi:hypothetical protein
MRIRLRQNGTERNECDWTGFVEKDGYRLENATDRHARIRAIDENLVRPMEVTLPNMHSDCHWHCAMRATMLPRLESLIVINTVRRSLALLLSLIGRVIVLWA